MNIIELGNQSGFLVVKSDVGVYPMLERFANAVIKAHTEELIAGVGEPACNVSPYEVNTIYWNAGHADAGCNSPLYTAAQVAAAVAKATKDQEQLLADYRETVDSAVAKGNRIATLESTLRVALWALDMLGHTRYSVEEAADTADVVIHQIKEVLHAE